MMLLKDILNHKPKNRYITLPAPTRDAPDLEYPRVKRCPSCGARTSEEELAQCLKICPGCGHHYPLSAGERIWISTDEDSFEEFDAGLTSVDPLQFPGYPEKLTTAREETCLAEAVITGAARISNHPVVLGVMDSHFMMGSMGSAVGEKITRAFERALEQRLPVIIFTTSGGARMQEGILSLMQMAKTSAAVARFSEAGLLYISVLTDPTTGGVTASFATQADIVLAEPAALVCFTGPRVIEQTIRQKLPEGFQRAEFLLVHGMIDKIVHRNDLKECLGKLVEYHQTGD